jgi:hypothetical protein
MQQYSDIHGCSPRSTVSGNGDFLFLLEAEMAQASARFQAELSRIHENRQQTSRENQDILNRCADMEGLLEQSEKERELAHLEIDRLERVVERLSEENRILSEELDEKNLEVSKVQMDEKYRRALVYIDALQSKLNTSSVPVKPRSARKYYN